MDKASRTYGSSGGPGGRSWSETKGVPIGSPEISWVS